MASTNAAPLGRPSTDWVGRRVVVQGPYGNEWRGMVQEVVLDDQSRINSLVLQPPAGSTVYIPGGSVVSVQPDGWSEALGQANDDFQLGG